MICRFSRQQEEEETDDTVVEVVSDNIIETSYHLKTGTIDILLCDDDATNNGRGVVGVDILQYSLSSVLILINYFINYN